MELMFVDQKPITYSGAVALTPEIVAVAYQIRDLQSRVAHDLSKLCYLLYRIKPLLGDDFSRFCREVFDFTPIQIQAWPRVGEGVHRLLELRRKSGGASPEADFDVEILKNFRNGALAALARADDAVVAQAAELAEQGVKVSRSVANELLSAREALADRDAELRRVTQVAEESAARAQNLQQQIAAMQRLYDDTKAQLDESEQEVLDLRDRQREQQSNLQRMPLVAITETAPGAKEAEAALEGINADISRATQRRDRIVSETQKMERDLADLRGRLVMYEQATTSLGDLKADLDAVMSKYSDVLLMQIRGAVPQAQTVLKEYADKLRALADHIAAV
jgi:hypothetical protein